MGYDLSWLLPLDPYICFKCYGERGVWRWDWEKVFTLRARCRVGMLSYAGPAFVYKRCRGVVGKSGEVLLVFIHRSSFCFNAWTRLQSQVHRGSVKAISRCDCQRARNTDYTAGAISRTCYSSTLVTRALLLLEHSCLRLSGESAEAHSTAHILRRRIYYQETSS